MGDGKPEWLATVERELISLDRPYVCVVLDKWRAMQLGNMARRDQIDLLKHVVNGLEREERAGLPDPGAPVGG